MRGNSRILQWAGRSHNDLEDSSQLRRPHQRHMVGWEEIKEEGVELVGLVGLVVAMEEGADSVAAGAAPADKEVMAVAVAMVAVAVATAVGREATAAQEVVKVVKVGLGVGLGVAVRVAVGLVVMVGLVAVQKASKRYTQAQAIRPSDSHRLPRILLQKQMPQQLSRADTDGWEPWWLPVARWNVSWPYLPF